MPTIALLTDFGLQDHYVGAMKGAILTVCPEATLVDVVHEIPAHDVLAGALALEASYGAFPEGTVFLTVVDPSVGSPGRPIAVEAGRRLFVGPDNGILTFVLAAHPDARVHVLANPALARQEISPVFHGRDLFGPVAGSLARGLPFVRTYADVAEGEPCALVGSGGRLEIAVNRGRADCLLAAQRGALVLVRLTRRGSGRS